MNNENARVIKETSIPLNATSDFFKKANTGSVKWGCSVTQVIEDYIGTETQASDIISACHEDSL